MVEAELHEEDKLKEAFTGCDGVISALGDDRKTRPKTHNLPQVWNAMKAAGVTSLSTTANTRIQQHRSPRRDMAQRRYAALSSSVLQPGKSRTAGCTWSARASVFARSAPSLMRLVSIAEIVD